MTVTPQALRVYATLKGLKQHSDTDVMGAILPFTMPVLEVMNGKVFTPELLALGLRKLYGWNVSTDVAAVFQKRLEEQGYLIRSGNARILLVAIPEEHKSQQNGDFSAEVDEIVEAFKAFTNQLNDLLYRAKSKSDLLDILVKFTVSLDISYDNGGSNGDLQLPEQLRDLPAEQGLASEDRYLCARFVSLVSDKNPTMLSKLSRLAAVGMLTEVVQDFVKPSGNNQRSKLTLILDAPLALAALGVSGKQALKDINLTLEAARSLGCQVIVLEESCEEMTRILKTTLNTDRASRHGPTHTAIVRQEVKEDYVAAVRGDPEKALKAVGITVRPITLDSYPGQHQFFDNELYQEFLGSIRWRPDSPAASKHDAVAMTLACRLRAGHKTRDIFENTYVFVTNNALFAKVAQKFSLQKGLIQDRHCPPVVHQPAIATAAWLRTGFGAVSDIPMAHLLAHCERILSVKKEVVSKAKEVIRSYSPDQQIQFELLLQDSRSVTKMMDLTLGEEDNITSDNIEELLNEMRRATAAEIQAEYESKLAAEQKKSKAEAARKKAELEAVRVAGDKRAQELEERLFQLEREKIDNKNLAITAIDKSASETAVTVSRIQLAITTVAVAFGIAVTLNQILGWLDLDSVPGLSTFGAALAIYGTLQQFVHWPKWGLGTLLNFIGRRSLRRKLEAKGLITIAGQMDFNWDFGRPTRGADNRTALLTSGHTTGTHEP